MHDTKFVPTFTIYLHIKRRISQNVTSDIALKQKAYIRTSPLELVFLSTKINITFDVDLFF
jgi:hypothetical protein